MGVVGEKRTRRRAAVVRPADPTVRSSRALNGADRRAPARARARVVNSACVAFDYGFLGGAVTDCGPLTCDSLYAEA